MASSLTLGWPQQNVTAVTTHPLFSATPAMASTKLAKPTSHSDPNPPTTQSLPSLKNESVISRQSSSLAPLSEPPAQATDQTSLPSSERTGTDETRPNSTLLYACNGKRHSCKVFLIFRSQFPYDSVPNISNLTSSDPRELAHINNISNSSPFPPDKEAIVLCSLCKWIFRRRSNAFSFYIIPDPPAVSPPLSPIPRNRKSRKRLYVGIGTGLSVMVLCFVLFMGFYFYKRNKVHRANVKEGINKLQPEKDLLRRIANVDHALKPFKRMRTDVSKEIQILNKTNHSNMITLYGACEHHGVFYLIYEYMENSSLKDWLQRETCQELQSWNYRLQVALDRSKGQDCKLQPCKISRTRTRRYVAPEYLEAGLVTPMMNVNAFGVVMLQKIMGKGAVFQQDGEELLLSEDVLSIIDGGNEDSQFRYLIDPRLQVKHPLGYIIDQSELKCDEIKCSMLG
ncbi:protein kinase family protein [Actinidia rufa]|uniref:Protein kinase family protein n=1 Tax=Actinidia rufa TaxID=165716 RepID=A0A7J0H6A5_9ERIC|nr:protein kinase family protein [Actinidia rufa]